MDFGLKEISITIIIGAYTILGFEIILFNFFGISLTGYVREIFDLIYLKERSKDSLIYTIKRPESSENRQSQENPSLSAHHMRIAIFVCLSFGIGILAEDLSYKFVDNELPFNLPSRFDSRVISLIGDIKNPEITPLAKELAKYKAFTLTDPECGFVTESWLLNNDSEARKVLKPCEKYGDINKQITVSIQQLYYHAKNNVYLGNNYYDEMKKIQSRYDFTRSIAVISFCYLVIIIIIFFGFIIYKATKNIFPSRWKTSNKAKARTDMNEKFVRDLPSKLKISIYTALILILIIFFTTAAFYKESAEYNKRAFGYFLTIHSNQITGKPNIIGSN